MRVVVDLWEVLDDVKTVFDFVVVWWSYVMRSFVAVLVGLVKSWSRHGSG